MQAEQLGGCRQGTGWELKHGAMWGRVKMGVGSLQSWRNCPCHPTRSKETQEKVLALSWPSLPRAQQLGKAVCSQLGDAQGRKEGEEDAAAPAFCASGATSLLKRGRDIELPEPSTGRDRPQCQAQTGIDM